VAAEHSEWPASSPSSTYLQGWTPVGQDWGGPIGLGAAARDPERVAALAILNTWACSVTVESAGHYLQEDVPGEVARSVAEWHPSRTGAAAAPR